MPITDVNRVKRALRIPAGVTVSDARITEICAEVDSELLQEVNLTSWDSATQYYETLDILAGSVARTVTLRHYPVTSVVALTASGVSLVEDDDYRVDPGGSIRLLGTGTFFEAGNGTVEVTYTAGHISAGSTPAWLLRLGTLMAARQFYQEAQAGVLDLSVDPIRQVMAAFDEDQTDREIQRALARWRLH